MKRKTKKVMFSVILFIGVIGLNIVYGLNIPIWIFCFLIFACPFVAKAAFYYIEKTPVKKSIFICIYALCINIALLIQKNVFYTGNIADSYLMNYINNIDFEELLIAFCYTMPTTIILFSVVFVIEKVCAFISKNILIPPPSYKHVRLLSFIILLAGWSIYLVTHFPGTAMSDAVRTLSNPIGTAWQHTLFYNLLLSGIFKLGTWITCGSSWGGAFLYSIFQMVYVAYIISYIIEWMSHRNILPLITLIILFFYTVSPMTANIAIVALKDSIWGATFLLYIPLLMEIHDSQGLVLQRKNKLLYIT